MLEWLRHVFRDRYRFLVPVLSVPVPQCRIRHAVADDYESCEAIYRLNEAEHFPEGYFDHFSKWLREGANLVLVAEIDGRVRALGGVARYVNTEHVTMAFGMVEPAFQKKRLGTALLLARLAALPEPRDRWAIHMSTTGGSHTFFERFGFRHAGRFPDGRGMDFDWYRAHLYREDWQNCRSVLAKASIELHAADDSIPSIAIPQALHA